MEEVAKQMQPLQATLQKVHEWQLGWWSNGSKDRPPGFFQNRMKEDDRWRDEVRSQVDRLSANRAADAKFILELRMARKFREQREAEAKARRNFWIVKVGVPVLVAILGLIGVAVKVSAPIIKVLVDDYLRAHPYVTEHLKKQNSSELDPAYAGDHRNSADLPPTFER